MRGFRFRSVMGARSCSILTGCFILAGWASSVCAAADRIPTLQIEVDARDLPRRLLHSRLQVPCEQGPLRLWFPKWVPGTHGPYGPVQNVGGLRIRTAQGETLSWRRDEAEPYRIECDVPAGTSQITVDLDTICN